MKKNFIAYCKKSLTAIQILRFILIYSSFAECNNKDTNDGYCFNQEMIAKFLNRSWRHVNRLFVAIRTNGLMTIIDKVRLRTRNETKERHHAIYYTNVYSVNKDAINTILVNLTDEDILANIDDYESEYTDFLKFVYTQFAIRRSKASGADLTDEDISNISKAVAEDTENKIKEKKTQQEKLCKDNKKYLDILEDLNKDSSIKMNYLDKNKNRMTNIVCATKNPDNHSADEHIGGLNKRMDMLSEFFDTTKDNIVEFDTNASIYRLSYSLGNECLASHTVDMYEAVYNACDFGVEWSKEIRNAFKLLLMPIYMAEWTISYKCSQYQKMSHYKKFFFASDKKTFEFYKQFVDLFKMPLKDILTKVANAMHEVFNMEKFERANIFIHESNLHILMLKKFKDLGIRTIDVYDGFYFKKGTMTQELYDKIYDEASLELINDFKAAKEEKARLLAEKAAKKEARRLAKIEKLLAKNKAKADKLVKSLET